MTQKKKHTNILRIYGKKPRTSKTSKRLTYKGFNFFLHRSTVETGGHIMLYWDKEPYPNIALIVCRSDDVPQIIVEQWLDKNMDKLIDKLQHLNDYAQVPREFLKKISDVNNGYRIIEGSNREKGFRLITHKHNSGHIYLWCNPNEAPTKSIKGTRLLDGAKIYKEYLKRIEKVKHSR